jgi:hypothetical protein
MNYRSVLPSPEVQLLKVSDQRHELSVVYQFNWSIDRFVFMHLSSDYNGDLSTLLREEPPLLRILIRHRL